MVMIGRKARFRILLPGGGPAPGEGARILARVWCSTHSTKSGVPPPPPGDEIYTQVNSFFSYQLQ